MTIRKAHAQAAKELDEDGWEQSVERFVPLAKLSAFRNFDSDWDEQRVAKVWHIIDGNSANGNSVTLKAHMTSFALKPMKSQELICANAITPFPIKAISFSFWWHVFTILFIYQNLLYMKFVLDPHTTTGSAARKQVISAMALWRRRKIF